MLKIFSLKPRRSSAIVILREVFEVLDLTGEKSAAQGRVGDDVLAVGVALSFGYWCNLTALPIRSCHAIQALDLFITGLDLLGVKIIEQS